MTTIAEARKATEAKRKKREAEEAALENAKRGVFDQARKMMGGKKKGKSTAETLKGRTKDIDTALDAIESGVQEADDEAKSRKKS
jgi:hypothetical protein